MNGPRIFTPVSEVEHRKIDFRNLKSNMRNSIDVLFYPIYHVHNRIFGVPNLKNHVLDYKI